MGLLGTFIRRPVMTTMLGVTMLVMGIYSYSHLVTELLPRVNFPIVVVTTVYPGASPAEVESQLSSPIEDELATLASIEELTSTSMASMSQVIVQFELEKNQDQASIDVKDKVDSILGDLPDNALAPVITKFDMAGGAVLELAISADRPLSEIYSVVDQHIADRLSRVEGVAEVDVIGQQERQIQVAVQPERLRAYGLTLLDLLQSLAASNLNVPVGTITRGDQETTVRMTGEVTDPEELAFFRLNLPSGGTIPLSEVALILDTTEELREKATYNGEDVIVVALKKRSDGNTVDVVENALLIVEEIRAELGDDFRIDVVQESASFVKDSVRDVLFNITIGILLTGILLYVFLHNWRTTVIAAVSMPVAVISSFMLMEVFGFTLNVMSLMALGISIGTLVTNSIVVLENISRHIALGDTPEDAAARGAAEVGVAVLASTLTNVVVFAPIAFMSGIIGKFFLQFGMTVIFATLFSLVVSFTMVPMLAASLIRKNGGASHNVLRGFFTVWDRSYEKLEAMYHDALAWSLKHRWAPVLLVVALFAGSMQLFGFIGGEFTPVADQAKFQISLGFPAGTSLDRSMRLASDVAEDLRGNPHVDGVMVKAGGETRSVEDVDILVRMRDKQDRDIGIVEFMNQVRPTLANLPDAEVNVMLVGESRSGEKDLSIELIGDQAEDLQQAGDMIKAAMLEVPGLVDVQSTESAGKPEIQVKPRRQQLADQGLLASQLGSILRVAYEGEEAGVYREAGKEYDVVVKFAEENRRSSTYLEELPLATRMGTTLPLGEVATLEKRIGEPTLYHSEKTRLIKLTANIGAGSLSESRATLDKALEELDLPESVTVSYGGDAKSQDDAFASILEALLLAIVLLYIVMAAILESFRHPFTVMMTLPLSLIGMALALFFSGETINIMSLMALVMMIGIVVNNAILLLDYTNQLREEGLSIGEALLKACPTRLRPILMANLAIAIGMIPQVLGGGAGSEFRTPMAIVQIGGVLVSALFTLFLVPIVYTWLDKEKLHEPMGLPLAD